MSFNALINFQKEDVLSNCLNELKKQERCLSAGNATFNYIFLIVLV